MYAKIVVMFRHRRMKDLSDAEQSVSIVKINTNAHFKGTDSRTAAASSRMTVVDRVTLEGLTVGEKYTIKGRLMDKETGKELKVNGKSVTAERTFTAKAEAGYVDMEFTFDGSKLVGKSAVVFERLFYAGVEITKHEDLNAKSQIVTIEKPKKTTPTPATTATPSESKPGTISSTPQTGTKSSTPGTGKTTVSPVKTGDAAVPLLWITLLVISLSGGVAAFRKKGRT